MTEEEFQQRAKQFIQQLPDYPQLGKRPFGYPKDAWRMSGLWAVVGMIMQVPILFADGVNRGQIISSILGAIFVCCAFTMRVVAFSTAAGGSVDRWLIEQLGTLRREADESNSKAS